MKMLFASIVSALLAIGGATADTPVKAPDKTDQAVPKAVIAGPTTAPVGRMVILKMTGSLGDDPQITCTPKNTNWYQVRFSANELGVVFDTTTPGDYIFAFAVNKGGRTAITMHVVTIGSSPNPGPTPPGPASLSLKEAYQQDLAAGVGKKGSATLLAACYSQAPKGLFPSLKTNGDLQKGMHQLIETTLGPGQLPNTRKAIAADVIATLGSSSDSAINVNQASLEWVRIAGALIEAENASKTDQE